jgi:hypothetical protein
VQLSWAWNEVAVMDRLFPPLPEMALYQQTLRRITAESNDYLLRVVEDLSIVFSDGRPHPWTPAAVEAARLRFLDELLRERSAFVSRSQDILLGGLPAQALQSAATG